jgi:hypothetical protein
MAQFKAITPGTEVHVSAVKAVINSMERGKETRNEILLKHGINIEENEWFLQQDWLDSFKEIAENLGERNLFMIGKAIIENAQFPPINTLQEGLGAIDVAYHMNHKIDGKVLFDGATGKISDGIGNYKLVEYNEAERKAKMICDNPYPSEFDRGIITQVVRKFRPADSFKDEVTLDLSQACRSQGGDSCTYNISW